MNCHFCNQPIPKVSGRLHLCRNHPHKVVHVSEELIPVINEINPFHVIIRLPDYVDVIWYPDTKKFYVYRHDKCLLTLDKFPSQITPENAADEILFYLTFS